MRNTNRSQILGAAACALVFAVGAVAQDTPAPILNHTFEENDGGWQGFGGAAIVSVTHDAGLIKAGKGTLQLSYSLKKGEFSLMLLPTPEMSLAKAKSIRFWIKTDHATSLAVVLQEKDGGRYNSILSTQKDTWLQVELGSADFILDRSKDAPNDPDNKLDMDLVQNIGIADMAQIFIQGDQALADAFGISEGSRKLYMDDFTVKTPELPSSCTLKAGEGVFDTFSRPQIGWIAAGQVDLTKSSGKPLEGAGMQVKYHQGAGKIAGFARYVPIDGLKGATKIAFSAASLKPAKLLVQVEEKGGGKYNAIVELPGNSGRADLTLKFEEFTESMDSKDDNKKLDLDQVTQLLVMDMTGPTENPDVDNTLWVNNIRAMK